MKTLLLILFLATSALAQSKPDTVIHTGNKVKDKDSIFTGKVEAFMEQPITRSRMALVFDGKKRRWILVSRLVKTK